MTEEKVFNQTFDWIDANTVQVTTIKEEPILDARTGQPRGNDYRTQQYFETLTLDDVKDSHQYNLDVLAKNKVEKRDLEEQLKGVDSQLTPKQRVLMKEMEAIKRWEQGNQLRNKLKSVVDSEKKANRSSIITEKMLAEHRSKFLSK